jgi:hypothetical protein
MLLVLSTFVALALSTAAALANAHRERGRSVKRPLVEFELLTWRR